MGESKQRQANAPRKPPVNGREPTRAEINQLIALFNSGRHAQLESQALLLVEQYPDLGFVWKVLGASLQVQGKNSLPALQKAAKLLPDDAEVHNNLGNALKNLGQLDGAVASYRRALELKPAYAMAHNNLGNALKDLGQLDGAVASYRRALEIKPDFAGAHCNLGKALQNLGQLNDAIASFRRALELQPGYADAHNNLGNALLDLRQFEGAVASYRRTVELQPGFAEAHNNLGNALQKLGQLDDAVASYRRALEIKPDYAEAHSNLGSALRDLGQLDDAVACYRRALEIKPGIAEVHSNLLFCLTHNATVNAETIFFEHCRFGAQFETPFLASRPQYTNSRNPERPLQVGFVSGDLRNHPVSHFIEPLLVYLSKYPQLSLHAYSNHPVEDAVTQRIREYFMHWNFVVGLSDADLAEKIRADSIDILIDLSGHTAKNRLLTFARKPVPVQASWIGYLGTTGLQSMDYYLADRFFLPEEKFAAQFTEKIVYLPAIAPFMHFKEAPPVNVLPALSNGFLTFGSFNRLSKISFPAVALWSRLLRALPESKMVLGAMPQNGCDTLIDWFAQESVVRERLSFHPKCGKEAYLTLHHQVDICLDTFPYSGGTTTNHALWMGVPTLTLPGNTPSSRVGATYLSHVGLEGFVAQDAEDFVKKGLKWAQDVEALARVRAGLRGRFEQSALGQPALIAECLERALRLMWRRWCEGLLPETLDVSGNLTSRTTHAETCSGK